MCVRACVRVYVTLYIWSASCLYTVTGWGAMSFVSAMTLLCGGTSVKVPLSHAGTVPI